MYEVSRLSFAVSQGTLWENITEVFNHCYSIENIKQCYEYIPQSSIDKHEYCKPDVRNMIFVNGSVMNPSLRVRVCRTSIYIENHVQDIVRYDSVGIGLMNESELSALDHSSDPGINQELERIKDATHEPISSQTPPRSQSRTDNIQFDDYDKVSPQNQVQTTNLILTITAIFMKAGIPKKKKEGVVFILKKTVTIEISNGSFITCLGNLKKPGIKVLSENPAEFHEIFATAVNPILAFYQKI
ncbi:hypothetical protein BDA99DRAFT_542723 [Phascolomyces articulosus]|uniref:Uncharacterized protein n=1 Tax=Phascolomyces articulosus TaxID=60185 RepID=A0AAD5K2C9_9FUNG|nr:hypothetical protein BDA99DRAFT_542723 [Phascolomyces articulosus]